MVKPISPKRDWTWDRKGRSNASPEFKRICDEVERLIRNDAFALISGNAGATARLIVAQLAHVHGMKPAKRRSGAVGNAGSGS